MAGLDPAIPVPRSIFPLPAGVQVPLQPQYAGPHRCRAFGSDRGRRCGQAPHLSADRRRGPKPIRPWCRWKQLWISLQPRIDSSQRVAI